MLGLCVAGHRTTRTYSGQSVFFLEFEICYQYFYYYNLFSFEGAFAS
jgi:hypothetical protein